MNLTVRSPTGIAPMPAMQVSPIELETELHAVHRLLRDKAAFDGDLASFTLTPAELRAAIADERTHVLVARRDMEIVGIATYCETYSTFSGKPVLWLDDLYVSQEYRRSGAGRALLRRLQRIAAAGGYARVDWIVDRSNASGIAFYEAMGATVLDALCLARVGHLQVAPA